MDNTGGRCKQAGLRKWLLTFGLFLGLVGLCQAQKTDTLYLFNGDRVIGEVKELRFEILTFSTKAAGTIRVKWHYVTGLKSDKLYEITMEDGSVYYGSLDSSSIDNNIFQLIPGLKQSFDLHEITVLVPIKRTFKSRIDGNVDLGFSYTKASDVRNLNLGFTLKYRAHDNLFQINYELINTLTGSDGQTARKQDLRTFYDKYFSHKWIFRSYATFEQNSELGLESRFNLGPALGYHFVASGKSDIVFLGGPQYSYETPLDDEPVRHNLEGRFTGTVKFFRVIDPELDIFFSVSYIPSFNIPGRYRTTTDANAKIELLSNLFLKITFYQTFDSDPVAEAAANDDYGVTTTFSYSF